MQNGIRINKITEENKLQNYNNSESLSLVCKLLPTLLIKTEFGVGKYQFEKIIYNEDNLELLFKLSKDNTSIIQDEIEYHIGNQFIISADQYLYAYRWYAIS
ncbi:MAG: hypothetical protein H8E60_10825 [Candidatus Marinimicrobia bacterium]|nr:hypothetical protein [Candidatus Neomarinimicrobiota bacterium]